MLQLTQGSEPFITSKIVDLVTIFEKKSDHFFEKKVTTRKHKNRKKLYPSHNTIFIDIVLKKKYNFNSHFALKNYYQLTVPTKKLQY